MKIRDVWKPDTSVKQLLLWYDYVIVSIMSLWCILLLGIYISIWFPLTPMVFAMADMILSSCETQRVKIWRVYPDSKVHGANMGPTWFLSAPDGFHVGHTNLAIRVGSITDWINLLNIILCISLCGSGMNYHQHYQNKKNCEDSILGEIVENSEELIVRKMSYDCQIIGQFMWWCHKYSSILEYNYLRNIPINTRKFMVSLLLASNVYFYQDE